MKPIEIISIDFFVLAGITILVYHLLTPRAQTVWLLMVSYFFYATWSLPHLGILIISTCLNFILAHQIENGKSRFLFILGLLINAGSLATLKLFTGPYGVGFLESIEASSLTGILLPIGFSFYVLQNISYLIDVYRGQAGSEKDFIHFALYTAYFPKMLAGPIERAKNFLSQLSRTRVVEKNAIEQGLYLIVLGLIRKIVIADHLSRLRPADIFSYPQDYSSLERTVWLLVFAFIIYNDFAGYTSIVRGISCLLGIQLSPNFRQPFLAKSFSDFWTRWHITLSEWLRDYIFYPSRRWFMSAKRLNWMAWLLPPIATMFVSGFWHGASLALVLWGLFHGLYLVLEQMLQQKKLLPKSGVTARFYSVVVFILVTLAWIPFNTPSVRSAGRYLIGLLPPYSISFDLLILPDLLLILLSLWLDLQEQHHNDLSFPRKWSTPAQSWGVAIAILLIYAFATSGEDISRFVYQFF